MLSDETGSYINPIMAASWVWPCCSGDRVLSHVGSADAAGHLKTSRPGQCQGPLTCSLCRARQWGAFLFLSVGLKWDWGCQESSYKAACSWFLNHGQHTFILGLMSTDIFGLLASLALGQRCIRDQTNIQPTPTQDITSWRSLDSWLSALHSPELCGACFVYCCPQVLEKWDCRPISNLIEMCFKM